MCMSYGAVVCVFCVEENDLYTLHVLWSNSLGIVCLKFCLISVYSINTITGNRNVCMCSSSLVCYHIRYT